MVLTETLTFDTRLPQEALREAAAQVSDYDRFRNLMGGAKRILAAGADARGHVRVEDQEVQDKVAKLQEYLDNEVQAFPESDRPLMNAVRQMLVSGSSDFINTYIDALGNMEYHQSRPKN